MNVASKELCQELYEVSGWGDTYLNHWVNARSGDNISHDKAIFGYGKVDQMMVEAYPAYDAGYLLRKLPIKVFSEFREQYCYLYVGPDEEGWQAGYEDTEGFTPNGHVFFGDTPENTLCKLAIELFKQGILNK